MKKLTIKFSLTECWRCTAKRQVRVPCPECGARPKVPEADVSLQQRQRAVAAVRQAEPVANGGGPSADALALFEETDLVGLVSRIWDAAAMVADARPEGSSKLAAATAEVESFERWATNPPWLRPMLALTETVALTIAGFRSYLDAVLDAVAADTISEVQRTQTRLQDALDSITEAASELETVVHDFGAILEADDPVGAVLRLAIDGDFLTAAAHGGSLLSARLGVASDSAHLLALAGDAIARTVGDPTAFWAITAEHLALLRSEAASAAAIFRLPEFAARQAEVAHDGLAAARRAARVPDALTDREALTDLLEMGHLLVEQPLKLHLGLACAVTTKLDFERSQRSDVSDLIGSVSDKGWLVSSHLPPSTIRNGFAHRRYAVDGTDVVFKPKAGATEVRMSSLELQDAILRTVEAVMAMELATAIVADEAGIEPSCEVPAIWMAEALMAGLGWGDVSVEIVDRAAVARAHAGEDCPLAALAFFTHPLLAVADRLDLHIDGPSRSVHLVVPLDQCQTWDAITDVVEKSARYVVLSRSILRDGSPLISDDAARKVLAYSAAEVAVDEERSLLVALANLRSIRDAARDLGYRHLARLLGRLVQWRSMLGTDTEVAYDEIAEIFDVMAVPVDQPSEVLLNDPGW